MARELVRNGKDARALADLVDDMLRQLGASSSEPAAPRRNVAIKASLFERCIDLCRSGAQPALDSRVRTVHHLSCTGGTLIAKCLAAMPNTLVLNEINPLSRMLDKPEAPDFAPTDLAALVRMGDRGTSDELLIDMFLGQLALLRDRVTLEGRRLLLRDHSHSQFLYYDEPEPEHGLLAVVRRRFPTISLITVRDPIDSFLSMRTLGWVIFQPGSLDEYCRRYHLFLAAHKGLPVFRYEDFLATPAAMMQRMCEHLELPFNDLFEYTFDAFRFSGDSGRGGAKIAPRPRREVPPELVAEAWSSLNYLNLCQRLGYTPITQGQQPQ